MRKVLLRIGLTILVVSSVLYDGNAQLSGYSNSCDIVIDHNKVSGNSNLSDFPMLYNVTIPNLKNEIYGGFVKSLEGYDIAFSNSDNSQSLDFELESYDPETGSYRAWIKIPTLSTTSDVEIIMHYGNSEITSNLSTNSTWSNNYQAVYHFNNNFFDASSNSNNGINYGSTNTSGIIGSGGSFDGIDDYVSIPNSTSLNISGNKITLQAWVKAPVPNDKDSPFLVKGISMNQEQYMLGIDGDVSSNNVNTRVTTTAGHYRDDSGNIADNQWTHVVMVYDGSLASNPRKLVYVNGQLQASHDAEDNIISTTGNVQLGKRLGNDPRYFEGILDEIRILNTNKCSDWIATEYSNQSNPEQFYTVYCSFDSSCGQKIDFVGVGANGENSVQLDIPNITYIDSIVVESIYKGTTPSNAIFSSSSESITDNTPEAAINGAGGSFMATMQPTNNITVTSSNPSSTQSAIAYIYRSNPNFNVYSLIDNKIVYLYRNSYQKTFSITESNQTRTITAYIPISELNNDSRNVEITASAGSVSRTTNAYVENLGESLRIFIVVLNDVPGDVTSVDVTISSPTSSGDSFVVGNIILNVPCGYAVSNDPEAIDDYKTTALDTEVDINVLTNDSDPDNDMDYGSVIVLGLKETENGTITNVDPVNGIITYVPNPGFIGTDNFEYLVFDETSRCSSAFVYITISQCGESYVYNGLICEKDNDNDGIVDVVDIDDDNDGILDIVEGKGTDPGADLDRDGILNYLDQDYVGFVDNNLDGVNDIFDIDFDGIPDYLDLDSDNDGIIDNIEAQSSFQYIEPDKLDIDEDGLLDIYDSNLFGVSNSLGLIPFDNDNNNIADFLDVDSDNDGLNDWIEAFDNDLLGSPYDEFAELAEMFTQSSGYDYYDNTIDENSNGIIDWLEVVPGTGSNVPAFLDPSSEFYKDFDSDGVVDLLDSDNFGFELTFDLIPSTDIDKAFRDNASNGTLPINLISFVATCNQSGIDIDWTTATETNNDYFTLEQSENGFDFEILDYVVGEGNTNESVNYNYFDNCILNGTKYYRLAQTDFDGKFETFEVISVTCNQNTLIDASLTIYPIPALDNLNIDINLWPTDENVQISLFDLLGKLIFSENAYVYSSSLRTMINLDNYNTGQYILRITGTSHMMQKNIIIK